MNWTSAQHDHGDGAAYRAYREAYFDAQDRAIAAQCGAYLLRVTATAFTKRREREQT